MQADYLKATDELREGPVSEMHERRNQVADRAWGTDGS